MAVGNFGVGAGPLAEAVQRLEGLAAEYIWTSVPRRAEAKTLSPDDGVVLDGADEIFGPLFDAAIFAIDPVKMWLQVAVGAGDVADFDAEEDVAAVGSPVGMGFGGLVFGDAARLGQGGFASLPACAGDSPAPTLIRSKV